MNDVKEYRLVDKNEQKEIDELTKKAIKKVGLSKDQNLDRTLEALDDFVESVKKNENIDIEGTSFELGSLYGSLFVQKHDWSWYSLELDSGEYYAVVSKDLKVANLPFSYFYEILKKERENNFVLTFNMVSNQYPKDWKFVFIH